MAVAGLSTVLLFRADAVPARAYGQEEGTLSSRAVSKEPGGLTASRDGSHFSRAVFLTLVCNAAREAASKGLVPALPLSCE